MACRSVERSSSSVMTCRMARTISPGPVISGLTCRTGVRVKNVGTKAFWLVATLFWLYMLQPGRNMLVSGVLSDRASYDIQESRRSVESSAGSALRLLGDGRGGAV